MHRSRLRACKGGHISLDEFVSGSILANLDIVDPDCPGTKILHGGHVVRDEQDGTPTAAEIFHGIQALLLKARIADGQYFVNDQDVRIEVGRHSKSEPEAHA